MVQHMVFEAPPELLVLVEVRSLRGGVGKGKRVLVRSPGGLRISPDGVEPADEVPAVQPVVPIHLGSRLLVAGHPRVEVPGSASLQRLEFTAVDVDPDDGGKPPGRLKPHRKVGVVEQDGRARRAWKVKGRAQEAGIVAFAHGLHGGTPVGQSGPVRHTP